MRSILFKQTMLLLCLIFSHIYSDSLFAQFNGTDGYIQGQYVEVGIDGVCGVLGGDNSPPAGGGDYGAYHPTDGGVGFMANPAQDGWASQCGDYFLPGSPFAGWSLSGGGLDFQNNDRNGSCSINGSITSLLQPSVNSGVAELIWEGTSSNGLSVSQTYTIGANDLYFVNTIEVCNTTAATITDVAYALGFDPDNDAPNDGNYSTSNTIIDQGGDGDFNGSGGSGAEITAIGSGGGCFLTIFSGCSDNDGDGLKDDNAYVGMLNSFLVPPASTLTGAPSGWTVPGIPTATGWSNAITQEGVDYENDDALGIAFDLADLTAGQCKQAIIFFELSPGAAPNIAFDDDVDIDFITPGVQLCAGNDSPEPIISGFPSTGEFLFDNGTTIADDGIATVDAVTGVISDGVAGNSYTIVYFSDLNGNGILDGCSDASASTTVDYTSPAGPELDTTAEEICEGDTPLGTSATCAEDCGFILGPAETMTMTYSGGTTTIDSDFYLSAGTVDFTFPLGSIVTSIDEVIVTFDKTDGNCASPGTGYSYHGEMGIAIMDPLGNIYDLIEPGDYIDGADVSPGVTITLIDDNTLPFTIGTPASGAFYPAAGWPVIPPSTAASGLWSLVGSDTAGGDPLCIISWSITLTAQVPLSLSSITNWYDQAVGGTIQATGTSFTPVDGMTAEEGTLDLSTAGTYTFYSECECDGCFSERTPYVLTVVDLPDAPTADALYDICDDLAVLPTIDPGTGVYNFYRDGVLIAGTGNHVGDYTLTPTDDESIITITEIGTGPAGLECEGPPSSGSTIEILDPITYIVSTDCANDGTYTYTISFTPDRGTDGADDDFEISAPGSSGISPSSTVSAGTAVSVTYPMGTPWSISVQNATLGDPDFCPVENNDDQPYCCPSASADAELQSLCVGDLPDLSVAYAFSAGIMDMNGQLNTTDGGSGQDNAADGVVWFPVAFGAAAPDPMTAPPYTDATLTVADACAQAGYRLYAFLQCDKDGDLSSFDPVATPGIYDDEWIPAGSIEAVVYPEVTASINLPDLPIECRVEVIPSCMDFTVQAIFDDEAFGTMMSQSLDGLPSVENTGTSYIFDPDEVFSPAGSIGEVNITVTNPLAPADIASTCISFDAGTQDYKCCIAEAGFPASSPICPDVYNADGSLVEAGEPMTVTVSDYEDFDLYSTYLIITDDAGMILEVIDLSDDTTWPATFSSVPAAAPTNQSASPTIPTGINTSMSFEFEYAHWTMPPYDLMPADGACEDGNPALDVRFYSYNDFDFKQPSPLPQAMSGATFVPDMQNAGNDYTSDISLVGTVDPICFDLSIADERSIPAPITFASVGPNVTEGATGGLSPFYYNIHQISVCGGAGPYDYEWEETGYVRHSVTGEGQIRILYADDAEWSVSVTDQNGCASGLLVFSNNDTNGDGETNAILDISSYEVQGDNPFTATNEGSIDIVVTGGDTDCGTYTYDWSGPSTWDETGDGTATISNCPSGWYAVTVTDCSGQTTNGWYWVNNAIPGTRSKSLGDADMMISPNPANDQTTVSIASSMTEEMDLFVYDISGRLLHTQSIGEVLEGSVRTIQLNTSELPNGTYLIHLNAESSKIQKVKKLVVTH